MKEQEQGQVSPLNQLYLIALAVVIVLVATFCVIIVTSLLPYFHTIGFYATGVVFVLLVCVSVLMVAFTYTRALSWIRRSRLLVVGPVVTYLHSSGEIEYLSAPHEAAKLPVGMVESRPAAAAADDGEQLVGLDIDNGLPMSDEDIAEMHLKTGMGQQAIADLLSEKGNLKVARHQVRMALIRQGVIEDSPRKRA